MSWPLVEELQKRFPEVEPFPHDSGADVAKDSAADAHPASGRGHGDTKFAHHVPGAWIPVDRLLAIARALRDEAPFRLDYCSFVSAVDWPDQQAFEVVYHLFSMEAQHELLIKVRVPRDDARLPSVTALWSTANWHEREAYDLFGITFEGHPDLRRIMMTEDWHGHPLRKDYVYEEPGWLVDLAAQRQREIEGLGLGERA